MPELSRRLILASGSEARQRMLRAAGVTFDVKTADIDEAALRDEMTSKSSVQVTSGEIAEALAAAKAREVSARFPDVLVIGSDQVLDVDGELFSKPGDEAGVRSTLRRLSGRPHVLHSAVTLARDGQILWSACETATLAMRPLSPAFIDAYVREAGASVHHCVGAYQLEGLGGQLFDHVAGSHFTVLGMPLLPLLEALRQHGVLAS
jgi:septum formation protein